MAADIHALEIEFAKNPTVEACIPLCEAYLAAKRYMEAMVVCKKGIKGAPQDPRTRVMLVRVYVEQGKGPKAQQELDQFLAEKPGDPMGLEMLGKLKLDAGARDEAIAIWQQALAANPGLTLARGWLAQLGIAAAAQPVMQPAPQMAPPQMGMPPQGAPPMQQRMPPPMQQMPPPMQQMPPARAGGFHPQPMAQPAMNAPPPPMGGPPGGMPPAFGMPAPGPAAAAGEAGARPLEHVSDFFAPDTLGFSNDSSAIETAGPGRLTILGFVPKSSGSIKTTLFIALSVLAIAGAVIFYQARKSAIVRDINKKYGDMKTALDDDKSVRYHDAIKKGLEILVIDDEHNLTLGALAYASAVLVVDFGEPDQLAKAKEFIQKAEATKEEETEYRVAAKALVAYQEQQYEQGMAEVKKITSKGGSSPLIELESFRLMNAYKPEDKETQLQMARLKQSVVSQARIFNYLGWYHYMRDEWALADKNFSQALQNVRGHPQALLGSAMTTLDRGIGLQELQKEVEKSIKAVMSMPPEDLSQAVLALGYFAQGQLYSWQNKVPEAEESYKQAFKLSPENPMFLYRRGVSMLKLGQAAGAIDFLKRAAAKEPNNVRYYTTLAAAQIKAKDSPGAKATLDRALQLNPKSVDLRVLDGDRLRADKKWADAIAAYKKLTKEDGGIAMARGVIGISTTLRESGKKADAEKAVHDFLSAAPGDVDPPTQAKLWCELGQDLEAEGQKPAALDSYNQGFDVFRYYADCSYFKCRALGKGPEAVESCKQYLALEPRGEYSEDAKRRSGTK